MRQINHYALSRHNKQRCPLHAKPVWKTVIFLPVKIADKNGEH